MTAKKKGLDGKACWKGYKQMGTKKKGGKTVDNCVKMSHGGALHGGQKKLDKNKDGKLSGADFKMMEHGGIVSGNSNRRRSMYNG
jgi:hypothetical protein|tara:strand:+ start:79 stop:333 length:255 start_codon:yes stop_codon:yes gene_type:complete